MPEFSSHWQTMNNIIVNYKITNVASGGCGGAAADGASVCCRYRYIYCH